MPDGLFRSQLLIATPGQSGGGFARSVILIAEHNRDGAMGLVVNKPVNLQVRDILGQMGFENTPQTTGPVFWGGPVEVERGFVLHRHQKKWEATLPLDNELAITTSRDILQAIGEGQGPEDYLVTLGYAGWEPGQLEQEVQNNVWLNTAVNTDIVFATPIQNRWSAAAKQLGINPAFLSSTSGHA